LLVVQGNLTWIVYPEIPTDSIANAPPGVKHWMQAVNQGIDETFSQGLLEAATFAICAGSEDKKEGSSAFLAKRPPRFLGC
jgi:enoyl-CoA hydratase